MSFILMQILLYLFMASLLGVVIGWILRGGCSKKIKLLEAEQEMKLREVEREWNTKLNYSDKNSHIGYKDTKDKIQASANLKKFKSVEIDLEDVKKDASPYLNNDSSLTNSVATALGTAEVSNILNTTSHEDAIRETYKIQDIDNIDLRYIKKLEKLGILTTKDLVEKLTRNYEDIDFIAQKLHIDTNTIISWISISDLLSLPGIDAKHAKLIQKSGISSALELSGVNTYSLHNQMLDTNNKLHIVTEIPTLNTLKKWAKTAKLLG